MEETSDFRPQSFAVVGAGPVGCIVAAFLSRGGFDVTLCDVMADLVGPASDPGITIEGAENFQQPVSRTCNSIDELADHPLDVIFLAVKAHALPLLASAIEGFYRDGMYVVSWQNGIDTELEIAKVLGKKAVLRAVVNYGCGLKQPCHVHMPFHHPPHFIQELDSESRSAAIGISKSLSASGLETRHTDDIVSMVWRKAVLNACMNPVCAVTGMTMAQAINDPIVFQLIDSLVKECVKIARANEISLGGSFYPMGMEYMKKAGHHKPSMLVDIENGRRTEIDYINGKFVEYGVQAGIETPYNRALWVLVKALEQR
ncbi:MAG: 2-dehydropantoate 2-reductase [Deltaproteobacteria bacterium]|nr:2-dehydropantoate 2-reductase [Deltaproteobacteria bacterium]MBW1960699.1 2-dehydropantoate 2-reductase [Deltaproteobacteria bacterium]MBW2151964.1 2-dehydropantoate 2-reductase [Deltaproteobacteria bacterium]